MNQTFDRTPPPPLDPGPMPVRSTYPVAPIFAALFVVAAILSAMLP